MRIIVENYNPEIKFPYIGIRSDGLIVYFKSWDTRYVLKSPFTLSNGIDNYVRVWTRFLSDISDFHRFRGKITLKNNKGGKMKIEVEENKTQQFPFLGIRHRDGLVVLFTAHQTGFVIKRLHVSQVLSLHRIGDTNRNKWKMEEFDLFEGRIILENEKK